VAYFFGPPFNVEACLNVVSRSCDAALWRLKIVV